MHPNTAVTLLRLMGPAAWADARAFARDLPPALAQRFERLLFAIDQGTADGCRAEAARVHALMVDHLRTGVWLDVLREHCLGDDATCCEHPGTPDQRLRERPTA
jgi:hypothetical protein